MRTLYIRIAALFIILLSTVEIYAQGLWTSQVSDLNITSKNGNVGLSWKTMNEENLRQFEIEYSADGRYYRNLGFIPARNGINGDIYQFTHTVTYSDSAFYRLKIVDKAGKWLYSDPIVYRVNKITAFFIYPSVITTGIMNIFVNDPFNYLQVVSMNGTVMLKQNLGGKTGRIDVPLSKNLASGTYVVQLANRDRAITQKVIIQ